MRQSTPNCIPNCIPNPDFQTKRAQIRPLPYLCFDPLGTARNHPR